MRIIDLQTVGPEHQRGELGGFYIRPWTGDKDAVLDGHEHFIDHVGNLVSGQVRVTCRKNSEIVEVIDILVPAKILIKADHWHEIRCLSDGVVWECWFAASEADRIYGTADVPWMMEKEI